MPSFSDSVVLFILALLLFGPKQLPKLARELGKWVGEFRRASNEFKMQMEEELRAVEQADRQKQIAAMEAAAPATPALVEPEHPSIDAPAPTTEESSEPSSSALTTPEEEQTSAPEVLPIATSGDLNIMPPATGLPTPRTNGALGGLLESIPTIPEPQQPLSAIEEQARENALHGD